MLSPHLTAFNYSIQNAGSGAVDVFIDGDIVDASTQEILQEWYGDDTSVSYKSFRQQLDKTDAYTYNIYINSGGGLVTDAMAMHDYLVDLQAKGKTVNTIGRGIIASAATYILMAGKKPAMSSNSWMMIHNVSSILYGSFDANELDSVAASTRKFNDAANAFYQKATGLSKTVIGNMMDAETWMTADEAKEKGFVAKVTGEAQFTNSIKKEQWQFKNTTVLNAYNNSVTSKTSDMDMNKITAAINSGFENLLTKLGLTNKAGDEAVKGALTEFTTGITNALKDAGDAVDETKVKDLVNAAVTEAVNKIGENAAFVNAITEATKNNVTKDDLNQMQTSIVNAVSQKLGGKSAEKKDGDAENKRQRPRNARNAKFAGYTGWEATK